MEEKDREKFCGNCGNHNAYDYPGMIFCTRRFLRRENPIVETLSCCGEWNPSSQECYCVQEALREKSNK